MKKSVALYFAALLTVFTFYPAKAVILDAWDFNTLTTGVLNPTTVAATVGGVSVDLSAFAAQESTNFAGSTLNLFTGGAITAGEALAIVGLSANGKAMLFSFSMLGYQDLIITFAGRGTATGYNSGIWSWSTDGTSYTTLTGVNTATTSTTFAVQTADFSAVNAIEDMNTVYLKYTLSGATSSSGNNRIDNVQFNVTPVPEPSTLALAALGGAACLFAFRRKK